MFKCISAPNSIILFVNMNVNLALLEISEHKPNPIMPHGALNGNIFPMGHYFFLRFVLYFPNSTPGVILNSNITSGKTFLPNSAPGLLFRNLRYTVCTVLSC